MKQRASQVSEELRKIISMILLEEVTDPDMGFVTITRIELTDDLRFARVFYSVLGDEEQKKKTAHAIAENKGYIKKLAIEKINMRYAMDIRFELDETLDHTLKIDQIIKKIKDQEQK